MMRWETEVDFIGLVDSGERSVEDGVMVMISLALAPHADPHTVDLLAEEVGYALTLGMPVEMHATLDPSLVRFSSDGGLLMGAIADEACASAMARYVVESMLHVPQNPEMSALPVGFAGIWHFESPDGFKLAFDGLVELGFQNISKL